MGSNNLNKLDKKMNNENTLDEKSNIQIQGHIKIFDPATQEVFVDKRNAIQVYASGAFGATRMDEKKVVEIKCSET